MILKILFIALAAICKAFVDTIAFHNGGVFHNQPFFDINHKGWQVPYTKYSITGFHIFNSLMIMFFIAAVFGFHWEFIVAGIFFVIVFNFFWNHILN